jgi:hypothetical protein
VEVVYIDKDFLHLAVCEDAEVPTPPPAPRVRSTRSVLVNGRTLPSGQYLQHTPQYFPPSPMYPQHREFAQPEDPAHPFERIGVDFNVVTPSGQPTRHGYQQVVMPGSYPSVPPTACPAPVCPTTGYAPQAMTPPVQASGYALRTMEYQVVPPPPTTAGPSPVCPTVYQQLPLQPHVNSTWGPPPQNVVFPAYTSPPPTMPQALPHVNYNNGWSPPNAPRTVSIKDVVELAQVGVCDDIIMNQMRNTNSKYALSVADIKYLKMCGVSDRVIIEMQNTHPNSSGAGVPQVLQQSEPSCPPGTVCPQPTSTPIPVRVHGGIIECGNPSNSTPQQIQPANQLPHSQLQFSGPPPFRY